MGHLIKKMKIKIIWFISVFWMTNAYADNLKELHSGFLSPPIDGHAQTWWHWTSPFVTKKGITADLASMKAIGYSGAHLFVTGSSPYPEGHYPEMLSQEWLALLEHAGKEAKRLGLKLGIHNCPGWSLSGGPWIKPEDAMQMIVSSEVNVSADTLQKIVLPQPETRYNFYRDIAVLAFPDINTHEKPQLEADFSINDPDKILDHDQATFIRLPIKEKDTKAVITLKYKQPFEARFIELSFGEVHLFVKGKVEASIDGIHFREVAAFDYKIRTDLQSPKCIRLKENTESFRYFRITFMHRPYRVWMTPVDIRLNDIRLLTSSMIPDVDSRNSAMEDSYSFKPFVSDYISDGIDPTKMLDLSGKMLPDGTLRWNPPGGNWTILRIGYTTTGKCNAPATLSGLECDKLSKNGLDAHWKGMMSKIIERIGYLNVLKYCIIDSYEAGGQNWTPEFETEFLKRRGYSLRPYLPTVVGYVVGKPSESARFLYDFQRTVAELFAENYYDYFTELCHKNGLLSITESYFGSFDYLRCARKADIPSGEFWIGSKTPISCLYRSAGHFHGKKYVAAEAFTTDEKQGRWLQDPQQLKEYGDRAWAQGISKLISHSFVHQPYLNVRPGFTLGRHGAHLSRTNTWWKYGNGWIDYINRAQFLLQSGEPVVHILILSGESDPNKYTRIPELSWAGYGYDYCCVDDLYDYITVRKHRITSPSGVTYSCLSLGEEKYLTKKTLESVYHLLRSGAVILGRRPLGSPSLSDKADEYNELVEKIWGASKQGEIRKIGKGKLINSTDYLSVMNHIGILPDVKAPAGISTLHRRQGDIDIFFLYNDSCRTVSQDIKFRICGNKIPEYWNADKAKIDTVALWKREGDYITIPVTMLPRESRFVIFHPGSVPHLFMIGEEKTRKKNPSGVSAHIVGNKVRLFFTSPDTVVVTDNNWKNEKIGVSHVHAPVDISDDWQVSFPPASGAPDTVHLSKLESLSENSSDSIRYFAGTATYRHPFVVTEEMKGRSLRILLQLGKVRNIAEIFVNGKKAALLWKEPFSIDITDMVCLGNNMLEIAVTTLWVNRLIGDLRNETVVPETNGWPDWVLADKPDSGVGQYSFSTWKGWKKEEDLQESGLIGPVRLEFVEVR